LQHPHDGPFEAGVYYVRRPGEPHGRITSITDKRFPVVIGDGVSSLEGLIRAHPRLRLQAAVFLRRHAAAIGTVPGAGVAVPLGRVGNHAQGTEFRDGRALWSLALERRIDAIARAVPGIHLGRFDIRYADRDAFMAGRDLGIVEFNGVTAEPTHIYGVPCRCDESGARASALLVASRAAPDLAASPHTSVVGQLRLTRCRRRLGEP
jgi:hypothetical protein